jgi:hypothetical protein
MYALGKVRKIKIFFFQRRIIFVLKKPCKIFIIIDKDQKDLPDV